MLIVAGPSGAGKSSLFSVYKAKGFEAFNVDDHAAALWAQVLGSPQPVYVGIPPAVRDQARPAMQRFIEEHLNAQRSFTFETTLRDVTFDQTRRAAANGFLVQMLFIAAGDVHEHIARVSNRAEKGGHSASPDSIAEIYARAMRHLVDAFDANRLGDIHLLHVFHNPRVAGVPGRPERIAGLWNGRPRDLAVRAPAWFHIAVQGTPYELEKLRQL